MKLSTKLVISFFVIVFMPILLAALAFLCIRLIQMKAVANQSTIDIGMLAYQIDTSQLGVLVEDMAVCIVLILVVTGLSITAWIYRGIVTPIYKLEEAAQNIKEGNLDFTVEAETNDEMGKLCRNFEDMRQRLKESAEEKLEAEKQNRILISNISHDLKTPITAIKGYVEGIMDGVADTPEKVDKYMRTIYSKAIDMDRLINELTLYAKIDTNRIPYDFKRMKASDYFDDCIEEIGLGLEAEHIGLSYFNYAEDSVEIIADPEQLKRVIDNIIGNSIKYMDKEHGLINIRVKDVGDFIPQPGEAASGFRLSAKLWKTMAGKSGRPAKSRQAR